MAANNGWTLANGNADIEIENAAGDIYGFKAKITTLSENRASQLTASSGESSPTTKSAEPFEAVEWTDWSYGMGQVNGDRYEGGTLGQGGNPGQYFYGDDFSLRPSKLLPGMARDQVYNTIAAAKVPLTAGANPVLGDEWEVPRGVLPSTFVGLQSVTFSVSSNITVTNLRALVKYDGISPTTRYVIGSIQENTVSAPTLFQATVSNASNLTGYKWITLSAVAGGAALNTANTYVLTLYLSYTSLTPLATDIDASFGCYIESGDIIRPYFQLVSPASSVPYKYWAAPPAKVEQVLDGTTYTNVAITTGAIINTNLTGTAGSAAGSPERTLSAAFDGSIVFNKNLYVGMTTPAINMYDPANITAAGAAVPTSTTAVMGFRAGFALGGLLYGLNASVGGGNPNIYKWTGAFPVTNGTIAGGQNLEVIIAAGKVGDPNTNANNMVNYQGSAYIFKAEGVFKIVEAIEDISTARVPKIIQVWKAPVQLTHTGKWVVEHQGKLYFNYKNLVMELVMQEDKPTLTPMPITPPWYRLSFYNYVNGLTSDGVNLYASLNNFGVVAYNGQGWHPITEFYELVSVEGQSSGLTWVPNPQSAPNYLFCGDGRTLLKIPIPDAFQPYTQQIYQNHQNKCGYVITPEWTGNLGDIEKNLRSVILRAISNGWSYKIVAVVNQTATSVQVRKTFRDGLLMDWWFGMLGVNPTQQKVVTQKLNPGTGAPIANTLAPGCWSSNDFNNSASQSKKLTVRTTNTTVTPNRTESVSSPVKVVKTQFILYFWNSTAGQANTIGQEVMSIDMIAVKHLPKLKYTARYQVALDLQSLIATRATSKNVAQGNDSTTWLRNQWVSGDPVYFRMYDMTGAIKQIEGIFQGNHADVFPNEKGKTKFFPNQADFAILSIVEEEAA